MQQCMGLLRLVFAGPSANRAKQVTYRTCPQCQEMLKSNRVGIAICDCGFDLRHAEPAEATPIQSWSSARMAGEMRSIKLIDEIDEIDDEEDYRHLAELIFQLSVRFDLNVKIKHGSATLPKTVDDAVGLIRPVIEMLEDLHPKLTAHIEARFPSASVKFSCGEVAQVDILAGFE